MIEKERKFLMKPGSHEVDVDTIVDIEQGYLILGNYKHLRVRIINDEKAFVAFKIGEGIERQEFEYEVPIKDAREMMSLSESKLKKRRYSFKFKGNQVDIDLYPDGLYVVEIEFINDLGPEFIPEFCGREISGESFYSNIAIANRQKNLYTND